MDEISAAASIIAVVGFGSSVILFLKDIKDAPRECKKCMIEISHLNALLLILDNHLVESCSAQLWYREVQTFLIKNSLLDQYRQAVQELLKKVNPSNKTRKLANILIWSFIKDDVASILARTERLKSLVNIAIEVDHVKLSRAIRDDTAFIRATLPTLQASNVAIEASTTAIKDSQSQQQHLAIMDWLSPTDSKTDLTTNFPAQLQDIMSKRQEGTGQWFLESAQFKRWREGDQKTLFCPGIPGAGKTIMAAIAIDHLCRTACSRNVEVAYVFCSYKGTAGANASNLFAAILRQLVQSRSDISAPLRDIYDKCSERGIRPSLDEIFSAIQTVSQNYATVYIVVDALDECTNMSNTQKILIDKLQQLQAAAAIDLRLMFTSRFISDITQKFPLELWLEVKASEEDVRRFVAGQIPQLPKCIQLDEGLKHTVQTKIIEAVDGMFLLARLHVDSLLGHTTKKKVLLKLDTFKKGAEALDQAYRDALDRIDGQLEVSRELARRALSWITYAQRLLTTTELCHALAIEPRANCLDPDNVEEIEEIVSVCAGLVTVEEESNIIRLVHYTTQEYFEQVRLEWIPEAQKNIAEACLTYLSFDTFRSGSCADDEALKKRLIENAFFDYASRYWSEHIRPVERATSHLALAFLHNDTLIDSAIQQVFASNDHYKGYSQKFPRQTTGLHMVAMYGLLQLIEQLLKVSHGDSNIEVDSKDEDGWTPLSRAADNGHEAAVQLLLDTNKVEADSKDKYGWTPLSRAADNGYEAVVRLLVLRDDVEADSKDKWGWTPLSRAVGHGHEAVVRLLLDTGKVEADSKDEQGGTPLSLAADHGHEAVVRLLLDTGKVKADSKDKYGWTPLLEAAEHGHKAVVRLLLDTGKVEADSKDEHGWTPLSRAAQHGNQAVMRLLLDTGKVEADSKDEDGQTPLSQAAANGHEAVARLLLDTGKVEADSKDKYGCTPLSRAAEVGHEAVVQLLVSRDDVDINSKGNEGRTPLSRAAANEHKAVLRLLQRSEKGSKSL